MKRRPAFLDRFFFSWRWQNETKYEKQELVPLYKVIINYYSCTTSYKISCCRDILGLVYEVSTNTNSYTYMMVIIDLHCIKPYVSFCLKTCVKFIDENFCQNVTEKR